MLNPVEVDLQILQPLSQPVEVTAPLCLAISYWNPNGNLPSSIRLNHFVQSMTTAGWRVALACGHGDGYSGEGLHDWYEARPPFRNNGSGRTAAPDTPDGSGPVSFSNLREMTKRLLTPIKPWVPMPDKAWWLFRMKSLEEWARRLSPDIIFSSSPPPTMQVVAGKLAARLGVPWVAELRDLWSDNFYERKRGPMRYVDQWLEHRTLGRANGMVTVSPPLAESLRSKYQVPVEVIYACFNGACGPPAEIMATPPPSRKPPLRLLYAGRVYPGVMMPEMISRAIKGLLDSGEISPEEIRVDFHCHNHAFLERWNDSHFPELRECCRVLPPIPHKEMLFRQKSYDALLHIGWFDKNFRGCVTSKFFEYLGVGRPILSTAKPGSLTETILEQTGAGRSVSTPERCADVLLDWIKQLRTGRPLALPPDAQSQAREFSCEVQGEKLSGFLKGFLR